MKHIFEYYNEVFPARWDEPALTDYNGTDDYTFGSLAQLIARLGLFFRALGVKEGEHIALCGRNCANWAASYLAVTTNHNVVVSILQDFTPDDIQGLVNHSDARLLIIGPYVWKNFPQEAAVLKEKMPHLKAVISLVDFSVLYQRAGEVRVNEIGDIDPVFEERYPNRFTPADVHYPTNNLDELMMINYTSGSMGTPKGVMLSYRSLSGNVRAGNTCLPGKAGDKIVSMLPLAHAFGLLADLLFPLSMGCHIYYLTKTPTPTLLMKAFAEVHPYMIASVPLVIEKICQKAVFPITNKKTMRLLWHAPFGIGPMIRRQIRKKLLQAFGGNLKYFIVGGAAINEEVERLLLGIHFPLIVGYGMTECGPLVGGCVLKDFVFRSAGHALEGNEVRIDSDDPLNTVGEIMVKGDHVMMGYYKNEDATKAAFTIDGWLKTGDLGLLDKKGNIFIKGRNKNMILSSTGQNIYPEEIEDKLNNMAGVAESVVVEREGKLVALVFPDQQGELSFRQPIAELMRENLQKLNNLLPRYSQIAKVELQEKEFEKTPKKSIKRFLYN
ncbi:MAG: AMP-binding protein [Paludibacteraceae bacterium]|nr:AMP-binding protein [Paludibacteraceae bacterium]